MDRVEDTCRYPEVPGESAIVRSARLGQIKLFRILSEGGANINDRNDLDQSVLSIAICTDTLEYPSLRDRLVLYIANRGASVNDRDKYGRTPLMHACKNNVGLSVINILLHYGATASDRDRFGKSALDYANKHHSQNDAIQQLVSSYEELNRTECNNNSGSSVFRREASSEKSFLPNALDLSSSLTLTGGSSPRAELGSSLGAGCSSQHRHNSRSLNSVPEGTHEDGQPQEKVPPKQRPQKVLRRRHTTDNLFSNQSSASAPRSSILDPRPRTTTGDVTRDLDDVFLEEKSQAIEPHLSTSPRGEVFHQLGNRFTRACTVDEPIQSTSKEYVETVDMNPDPEFGKARRATRPILRRQGSATKLVDELSYTRPGTLPALKVSPTRPIPNIGDAVRTTPGDG